MAEAPHDASTPRARSFGLDAVRAAASLMVVVSHYGVWWVGVLPCIVAAVQLCGHLGVEAFFVLSGWLIGGILIRDRPADPKGLVRFWGRRALRTMPPFLTVALVHAALLPPGPADAPLWRYLTQTAFMPLLGQHREVWFSVSWSLAVEEWAYLLVPLVLAVFAFKGRGGATPVLAIVLTVLLSIRWPLVFMGLPPADLMLGTPFRLDPVVWGMLAASLAAHREQLFRLRAGIPGVLAVAMFCGCWIAGFGGFIGTAWFETIGWTALDIGLAASMPLIAAVPRPSPRIARAVGALAAVSYPVYLVHLPFARALGAWPIPAHAALLDTLLALGATAVAAVLLHHAVEVPSAALAARLFPGKAVGDEARRKRCPEASTGSGA